MTRPYAPRPAKTTGEHYSRFANVTAKEARTIYEDVKSDPMEGDAEFAEATERKRAIMLRSWNDFISNKLGLDPKQIWFDFCVETAESIQACQAFLKAYIMSSRYQRLSLGPEEFVWAYRITCPDSVNATWKALIAEAEEKILKPARIAAMRDKTHESQARFWRLKRGKHGVGAHDTGPVTAISNWIYGALAEEFDLKPVDYEKVSVTAADMLRVLRALWVAADDIPCEPAVRHAMHGTTLMLALTGWRREMALGVKFSDVRLGLVRDPRDRNRRRVEVRVTGIKNKLKRTARRQNRSFTQVSFSATDTPVPLLCLTSLIVSSAISQGAFEYASVEEFLNRPNLEEDTDYLALDNWNKESLGKKVFPISSDLFSELWQRIWIVLGAKTVPRPYAMRIQFGASANECGVLAPASRNFFLSQTTPVHEKSYQTEHMGQDISRVVFDKYIPPDREFFERLRDFSLSVDPNAPIYPTPEQVDIIEARDDITSFKAQGLTSNLQARRKELWELAMQINRKEYFSRAAQLRRAGQSTGCLRRPLTPPWAVRWKHTGLDMALFALPTPLEPVGQTSFRTTTEWFVNYLRRNWEAIRLDPRLDNPVGGGRPTCLCCGQNFSVISALTRHCKKTHVQNGLFKAPYECPECVRLGLPDRLVLGTMEWSNHVERVHGKLHTPNLQKSGLDAPAKKCPQKPPRRCLICNENIEGDFERHFKGVHVSTGLFHTKIKCPECQRLGLQSYVIDDQEDWHLHVASCHGEGLRIRCLLCSEFHDKRGITKHVLRAHKSSFPCLCPECRRLGVAQIPLIEDYDSWRVHALGHRGGDISRSKKRKLAEINDDTDFSRSSSEVSLTPFTRVKREESRAFSTSSSSGRASELGSTDISATEGSDLTEDSGYGDISSRGEDCGIKDYIVVCDKLHSMCEHCKHTNSGWNASIEV